MGEGFPAPFRTQLGYDIFLHKYAHEGAETWEELAHTLVEDVCKGQLKPARRRQIEKYIAEMKFLPGGRYLYYAGRPNKFFNNCYLLRSESDTREDWAMTSWKSEMCLMTGGGIGNDYSIYRAAGSPIAKTGGTASGAIPKMMMTNEQGRQVMQGGSRRCLPDDTVVSMANGDRVLIQDVKVGDLVATRFGDRMILAKKPQGKRDIVKITLEDGSYVLSTPNHKWLAADNTRRKRFMLAESLSLNNKLYYHPTPITHEKEISVAKDFAYTMGYYMGDGCAYSSNRTHEITFQFSNEWVTDEQIKLVSGYMRSIGTNPILRDGHGDCKELRCRSKELVPEFQKWKGPNTPFRIPSEVYGWDVESRAAFLAGWWDADGSFNEDSWRLSNTHKITRGHIMNLLGSLGFVSTFFNSDVRLSSYQRSAFMVLVGKYMTKKPTHKVTHSTNEIPMNITSVELLPNQEETWDIQVDEVEEFIADHYISHNSAIYASLNWRHGDVNQFLHCKDWYNMPVSGAYGDDGKNLTIGQLKEKDFNYPAPLDMTNISLNYDNKFLETVYDMPIHEIEQAFKAGKSLPFKYIPGTFYENVRQALKTGEPGFSFNFFKKENETLRNACSEITSEDDSDVCNLGSVNMSRIDNIEEFNEICEAASEFLLCGTLKAKLPYDKVKKVREQNRRLGLGLMGVHEWLIIRGYRYEVVDEFHTWLKGYEVHSEVAANALADKLGINRPKAYRAIAPTGTIGILAGTTTGIEPLYAVAYKRRYLKGKDAWHYQYVIDGTAKLLIAEGADPTKIESAVDLASDVERRIAFQADVQDYVDMSISSTINIPEWGSEANNEKRIYKFTKTLLSYAHRLRGFTCYPDGARGGQPITSVSYEEALSHEGKEFKEEFHDICQITGSGGTCGV